MRLNTPPTYFEGPRGRKIGLSGDTIYIYIHHHRVGLRENKKMAGVYHFLVYMQTAQNTAVCLYTTTGAFSGPGAFQNTRQMHLNTSPTYFEGPRGACVAFAAFNKHELPS